MTETEKIQKYLNWPYSSLLSYLTRNGFTPKCAQRDRTHNLNKVTFIRSNKNGGHMKVTVWHMWDTPDQYGISKPSFVSDIDVKDLEPGDADRD